MMNLNLKRPFGLHGLYKHISALQGLMTQRRTIRGCRNVGEMLLFLKKPMIDLYA